MQQIEHILHLLRGWYKRDVAGDIFYTLTGLERSTVVQFWFYEANSHGGQNTSLLFAVNGDSFDNAAGRLDEAYRLFTESAPDGAGY